VPLANMFSAPNANSSAWAPANANASAVMSIWAVDVAINVTGTSHGRTAMLHPAHYRQALMN
jgi:hypothetical protein